MRLQLYYPSVFFRILPWQKKETCITTQQSEAQAQAKHKTYPQPIA